MKIALFCTQDSGGAGRAALRLNKGLNQIGQDSTLFVKSKQSKSAKVEVVKGVEINNSFFERINKDYFYKNIIPGNTIMSILYPSIGFDFLEAFQDYNIINVHWITSFLSLEAIVKLRNMGKPIVWTLHDQNAMTGGCHYTHGCDGYLSNCSDCPQIPINEYDITKVILNSKQQHIPEDVIIVTPSIWLAECAKKSTVFKKHRIEVIKNSVETDIFLPIDRSQARKRLNLPNNAKIILFGAENHQEKRKGFQQLLETIKILKSMERVQNKIGLEKVFLLSFGYPSEEIKKLGLQYKALGYVTDDKLLSNIYSAADVLALPSLEDNLPNIMVESISCGTPVVSFETGGMPDTIHNGITGYTVPMLDTKKFAERLVDVLLGESLRNSCRINAENDYRLSVQAKEYTKLFNELTNKHNTFTKKYTPVIFPEVAPVLMPYIVDLSIKMQEHEDVPIKSVKSSINNLSQKLNNPNFLRKLFSPRFLWGIFKKIVKHILPYGVLRLFKKYF